ncbi:MAG: hypothetical protein MUE45_05120 [Methanoregulaceae archaeon]|nr:hypothetical protein [Methanoregulaceae archaeon]MCU0628851.1 hypothetical protein [Methanoregulaceae archaeon]
MEEGTVVTPLPQTMPAIRKKGNFRKVAELLPAIAFYAMEHGLLAARPPVFVIYEASSKKQKQ